MVRKKNFIIAGNQRSFGDNSVNTDLIVSMKNFNQILSFDKSKQDHRSSKWSIA